MDIILQSIKKMLGIDSAYTVFDPEITMHINSAFMILFQLGVGPATGPFVLTDLNKNTATWADYLGNDLVILEAVKSYVYLRVKSLFDPPTNSALIEANNKVMGELEWRLNVMVDPIRMK